MKRYTTRKMVVSLLAVLGLAGLAQAKGLYCGKGGLSPMEARLEQGTQASVAQPNRIQNAQRASKQLKDAVPDAVAPDSKVSYVTVTKSCCSRSKRTCVSKTCSTCGKCKKAKTCTSGNREKGTGKKE